MHKQFLKKFFNLIIPPLEEQRQRREWELSKMASQKPMLETVSSLQERGWKARAHTCRQVWLWASWQFSVMFFLHLTFWLLMWKPPFSPSTETTVTHPCWAIPYVGDSGGQWLSQAISACLESVWAVSGWRGVSAPSVLGSQSICWATRVYLCQVVFAGWQDLPGWRLYGQVRWQAADG